jgi:hypothetical protein
MMVAGLELIKHHLHAFLFQGAARLRARIVEFRRLTDDNRS